MSAEATKPKKSVKTAVGLVVSTKCAKSAVVMVERQISHPMYKKFIKRSKKIMVHVEDMECSEGDKVKIRECRPYSKNKTWILDSIIEKARA